MSQNINKPKRFSLVGHEWIGDILEEKPDGDYVLYSDYAALKAEVQVLLAKVDWLQKADRLVVWTGTEWQIRHELDGKTEVAK